MTLAGPEDPKVQNACWLSGQEREHEKVVKEEEWTFTAQILLDKRAQTLGQARLGAGDTCWQENVAPHDVLQCLTPSHLSLALSTAPAYYPVPEEDWGGDSPLPRTSSKARVREGPGLLKGLDFNPSTAANSQQQILPFPGVSFPISINESLMVMDTALQPETSRFMPGTAS